MGNGDLDVLGVLISIGTDSVVSDIASMTSVTLLDCDFVTGRAGTTFS